MRTGIIGTVALLGAIGFGRAQASAAVLFTTQEDFAGFTGSAGSAAVISAAGDTDGGTTNGVGNLTNPGGTGTAGALTYTIASGTYDNVLSPGEQGNAAFLSTISGTTVTVDYTATVSGGNYFQLLVLLNGSGPGYLAISPDAGTTTGTQGGPQSSTYTIPVISPTESYFQFGFIANTNNLGTVTIDNVRTPASSTPEPASLSILGLGGLLLSRRRSRV